MAQERTVEAEREKWLGSGYILQIGMSGFMEALSIKCERKEWKMTSRFLS